MDVHVYQNQSDASISARSVKKLVKDFILFSNVSCDEVSIHFVDINEICKLHKEYFQDPSPTDCISFPMDDSSECGYKILGDVFVCPAIAQEYSVKHERDLYQEITLYVVHGLLHLQGYDDIEIKDRRKMRAAEAHYLSHVNENNLWLFANNSKNVIS